MITIITSKSNNLIKKTKKLLQKKYRKSSYLIEGWHLFEEAEKYGAQFLNIFVTETAIDRLRKPERAIVVTDDVLKELTDSQTPQGIVAEIAFQETRWTDIKKGRFLVLEDVQDPGNLGTMVRTADAANFDAVFLSQKSADLYNQKTLRSMQGSHFHLPVFRVEIEQFVNFCKAEGITMIATTLSEQSVNYKNLPKYDYFALIMGNEGQGISKTMTEEADVLAHIEMPGQAESLNVAVAAGVVIFSLI